MRTIRLAVLATVLLFSVAVVACSRDSAPVSIPSVSTPTSTPVVLAEPTPVPTQTPTPTLTPSPDLGLGYLETLPIATLVIGNQTITVRYERLEFEGQDLPPLAIYVFDPNNEYDDEAPLVVGDLLDDKRAEVVEMNLDLDSELPSLLLGVATVESLKYEGVGRVRFKSLEFATSYGWKRSANAAKTSNEESIYKILEGVDITALFDKVNHILAQLATK